MTFPHRRLTSWITILCFAVTQFAVTPAGYAYAPSPVISEVNVPTPFALDLPPNLGTIDTLVSGSGPAIIHIQEAHGNYDSQKKIERIEKERAVQEDR